MQNFLNKPINEYLNKIKIYHLIIVLVLIIAAITRLTNLGDRVMSHDEVNHVVPAFDLFSGRGYRHDPITHGPFQFHLMALSYFLFGDNDFSSRLPHALFSIATVAFIIIFYRKYLGKYGSLAAGIFFVISPFMLFYGRYARNESICAFLAVVSLYVILQYFEDGRPSRYIFLAGLLSLNFSTKETAYIFSAQLLIFLLMMSIFDLLKINWSNHQARNRFFTFNMIALLIIVITMGASIILANRIYIQIQSSGIPVVLGGQTGLGKLQNFLGADTALLIASLPFIALLGLSLIALFFIKPYLDWQPIKKSRAFNLLILIGTLVLPLLAPFPVRFAGMDPTAYSESFVNLSNTIFIAYLFSLGMMIGSFWDNQQWWKSALVFFAVYIILYTTFFTNPMGLITGMIGSLGHWVSQQSVQRGGQPYYYYAFILIPIYEFLGALGTLLAFYFGIKQKSFWTPSISTNQIDEDTAHEKTQIPVPAIFIYWTITSLVAYTFAGEKMPWLTVHIAFSMLLATGWTFERLFQKFVRYQQKNKRTFIQLFLVFILVILIVLLMGQLIGNKAPFQGKTQQQLQNTNHFFFLILAISSLGFYIFRNKVIINKYHLINVVAIIVFFLLALLTARTAYQSSFVNYDYPYEFLVYAHSADGPKIVLQQIEEISRRTTGGLNIKVAYDNHGLYPYWWYLRNYPNKIVYLENPTRALEEAALIIAGSDKYAKIDAIVRDNYYANEYMRLWWPMQDYWNLNWDRISNALTNPDMREALLNIWLNRDYRFYAEITGNQFLTLENWLPSERMRFYIRKDIASQMWQYHTEASLQQVIQTDPYKELITSRQADYFISRGGSLEGELNSPRGIDIAPDGSIYVADSRNHRIQQFSPDGELIHEWGTYANILEGSAPGGTFNEPWDVAVGNDGSIYVADTFNHRIQKFNTRGQFIKTWGVFAQGEGPDTFWGPRGITVDPDGLVLVTDTGNKRVVVFDKDLNFISQFGGGGFEVAQFDEPVGIAVSKSGLVAVADTWNRRVQVLRKDETGSGYSSVSAFDVEAWYGQSMDNKPYITFSPEETIIISDPEADRLLEFSVNGQFIRGWQDLSPSPEDISTPYGLDFDEAGNLWFSDSTMNMILRFSYE